MSIILKEVYHNFTGKHERILLKFICDHSKLLNNTGELKWKKKTCVIKVTWDLLYWFKIFLLKNEAVNKFTQRETGSITLKQTHNQNEKKCKKKKKSHSVVFGVKEGKWLPV